MVKSEWCLFARSRVKGNSREKVAPDVAVRMSDSRPFLTWHLSRRRPALLQDLHTHHKGIMRYIKLLKILFLCWQVWEQHVWSNKCLRVYVSVWFPGNFYYWFYLTSGRETYTWLSGVSVIKSTLNGQVKRRQINNPHYEMFDILQLLPCKSTIKYCAISFPFAHLYTVYVHSYNHTLES